MNLREAEWVALRPSFFGSGHGAMVIIQLWMAKMKKNEHNGVVEKGIKKHIPNLQNVSQFFNNLLDVY